MRLSFIYIYIYINESGNKNFTIISPIQFINTSKM